MEPLVVFYFNGVMSSLNKDKHYWGSLSVGEGWSEAIRQHLIQLEITFHFIQTPVPIDITFQIPFVKTVTPFRAYAQKMADA
jgi:hypothetical protein